MERIKCITFDKEAQDNLPKWVKDKMKKQRKEAESKQLNLPDVGKSFCGCNPPKYNYPEMLWCDDCGKKIDE